MITATALREAISLGYIQAGGGIEAWHILSGAGFLIALALLLNWLQLQRKSQGSVSSIAQRLLTEAAGGAIFEIDVLSRKIQWTHHEGSERLGCGDDLQFGTEYSVVHPDDRDALRAAWDGLALGRRVDLQLRITEPGGSWSWYHVNAIPTEDRQGRYSHAVGVMRNTNNLHMMQESLAEGRRLETVGTIAGGIAHEFNNHLTPVRGYLELALDDLPPDNPNVDGLRTALERVVHCSDLISQIQAYGRKSMLVLRSVNVSQELSAAMQIGLSIDLPSAQKVTVEEDFPDTLPNVMLDKAQFQQGIIHLVQNALESMPDGGSLRVVASSMDVPETEQYRNREAAPGPHVRIVVTDTGVGIREENLTQVMDPFFTTHGRARARGMGLPMVQGMIAQHGGWMDIQTQEGHGTSVFLYFPIPVEDSDIPPPTKKSTQLVCPAAEPSRVLIADDEFFIRDIARSVFENEGWAVEEAVDFDDVIERVQANGGTAYDVVVLDLTMPGPTAEETVGAILAGNPETRVVVASGTCPEDRIAALTRHPYVEFVSKPFSPKDVLQQIDAMLAIKA